MGLIRAALSAAGGILADQWLEYFYCEALPADVLLRKAQKKTSARSSNSKGGDNVISNGSMIAVADGQCVILVDQGKVTEVCAEPGEFRYDQSSEPSVFYGGLGRGILDSFKNFGKRFTFGGEIPKDQRVYFVNLKEIPGNKYGTAAPVPFRVVDKNIGLDIDIAIRCNGEFSYRVVDPILFYTNVCGNVSGDYQRGQIDSMLKTELLTALQPAFAKISELGVRYSALPGHTVELADALNEILSAKWRQLRGLAVYSFGVNSVSASPEDEDMIKQLQKSAVMRDPTMAAAQLVGAQSDAMRAAAANENGAMMGFMGLGMAQQAGGSNAQNLFAMGQNPASPSSAAPFGGGSLWVCQCATPNSGAFCENCGAPRPQQGWQCACGAVNQGKFCAQCGKPRPAGAPLYRCDKCGWTPSDPKNPPKFCPECGDRFDENDARN
ncbi:MAG: SPFH domain-containing protein [Oscillospiraceae bacterium]|jgi:membrane protease subunit (stomatin/prohibitin family)|nr:SPFH domain-containing protein [Oscillospiraceae bacterium]